MSSEQATQYEKNILVVDDSPTICDLLRHALDHFGLGVVEAVTGREALDTALRLKPAVIVLDVELPDFSGYQVCLNIRSDPRYASIARTPVIIYSARYSDEDRSHAKRVGANGFYPKTQSLLGLVKGIMRGAGLPMPENLGTGN